MTIDKRLVSYVKLLPFRIDIEEVNRIISEQYYLYGSPYIALCIKCSEYTPCILVHHNPLEDEENRNTVHGVLVFVDKDKELDENIELLFKLSTVVRSYGEKVSFYIPFEYSIRVLKKICPNIQNISIEAHPLKIEEAEIFLE